MKLQFQGEVSESGKLTIFKRNSFLNELHLFAGKKVILTVEKKKRKRSLDQNAYYWGVVVPEVKRGYYDVGYIYSESETHDELKKMFIVKEKVNFKTGEIKEVIGSSTELSTTEFLEFIAQIQQWGAEYLSIYIPDPGEQLEIPNL